MVVSLRDHETLFTGISEVLSGVCKSWPLEACFRALFNTENCPNRSKLRFLSFSEEELTV